MPDVGSLDMRLLRVHVLEAHHRFFTAFRSTTWPDIFNPSPTSDARFSPLTDQTGVVVPTLYGASTRTVALLETALHEVNSIGARVISEKVDLRPRGLVQLHLPTRTALIDLRDGELVRLGLHRSQLVSCLPVHYRCTREWAQVLHARGRIGRSVLAGAIWNSRIAELSQADSPLLGDLLPGPNSEVFVLFGDRISTETGDYDPSERHGDLAAAGVRALLDQIAGHLGATIA